MKKLICVILSLMMMVGLCACESEADLLLKVNGSWSVKMEETQETYDNLMESIELYEAELAAIDTTLYTVKTATFNADKTYVLEEKAEDVQECLREFFQGAFADLYEKRETLKDCYEQDISILSEEEFYQFYANLYSKEDFDALIEHFATKLYNYDNFEPIDEGTYTISSTRITLQSDDAFNSDDGYVTYSVDGDTLTLTWSNDVEVYTKVK